MDRDDRAHVRRRSLTRDDIRSESDWEAVLSAAAFVPHVVPDAILADERLSNNENILELKRRFASVLAHLERVSGWKVGGDGRIRRTLANFQGVETEIFDQARTAPLEITVEKGPWEEIVVPTLGEMLRIKAWLVISRNAARDYRDTAALADRLGLSASLAALSTLDELYPQSNGASALQQLARQLAEPRPFFHLIDSESAPRVVQPRWNEWTFVEKRCRALAVDLMLAL